MQRAHTVSRLVAYRNGPLNWRRFNSTNDSLSSSPSPSGADRYRAEQQIGWDGGPHSIILKFKHPPRNSGDVLATVQYLEAMYGQIDEFYNGSFADRKSTSLVVRFRSYDSASRALENTASHHRIPAPQLPVSNPMEGGLGLDVLRPFLDVKPHTPTLEPDFAEPEKLDRFDIKTDAASREFMYFKIFKAFENRSPPVREAVRPLSRLAMRNFVNWSGFAKIEPIPAGTFVLGQGDAVDHPIMRFVIGRYANMRDIRNPLEIGSQSPPATQRVWKRDPTAEPLPSSTVAVEEVVDVDAVESIEEVQVSRAPETSSPAADALPAAPEPIPESKPAQPLALANSPEAIAQLRAANSILKNLTKKPNKAKNPAQVQVQTNTNTRAGAQQSNPQKATTRPKTQPKASAPSQPKVSHSSSPSSPETNTAGESKVEPSPEESKKTSRLRGFMGNWF